MTRYDVGFIRKCAEYGVDPSRLVAFIKASAESGKGKLADTPNEVPQKPVEDTRSVFRRAMKDFACLSSQKGRQRQPAPRRGR